MQTYDYVMIGILIATTLYGMWKGMAWQIASLASVVVSYIAALRFSTPIAPYLSDKAPWNRFLAMFLLYVLCSLLIWGLFRLVAGFMDRLKLREFDRQLGGLLGFAKGVLFCVAVTFFVVTLSGEARRKSILESKSGYYIGVVLDQSRAVMPDELQDVLRPYLNRIEQEFDSSDSDASATVHLSG